MTYPQSAYYAIDFLNNQVCLTYLLRKLEYFNDIYKEETWSKGLWTLLWESIHQKNISDDISWHMARKTRSAAEENLDHLRKELKEFKLVLVKCATTSSTLLRILRYLPISASPKMEYVSLWSSRKYPVFPLGNRRRLLSLNPLNCLQCVEKQSITPWRNTRGRLLMSAN